jgi:DNA-binding NarL/FixJ family response regulator
MTRTTTVMIAEVDGSGPAPESFAEHVDTIEDCLGKWHGRLVERSDRRLVACFDSASDAARGAVALHQVLDRFGAARTLRIGIEVGERGEVDDDAWDAVLLTANQICQAAAPGQTLASSFVGRLAGASPEIRLEPAGAVELSGGPERVDTVEIAWDPAPSGSTIRVVVADDAALIRSGVVHLLGQEGFEVIAEASDYDSLVAAVDRDPPDLVITDIRMPPSQSDEGLRAAAHIMANHPGTAILVLSQYIDTSAPLELLNSDTAGVGYLLKERVGELDEFVAAARRVAAGGKVIDPLVAGQLLAARGSRDALGRLTEREREVLDLMAQGLSNQSIGDRLYLSPKTVETHVGSIFTKLDLPGDSRSNRRVRAVVQWLEQGPA